MVGEGVGDIELGPPEWVVNHWLMAKSFGPLAGEQKSLKSWLMTLMNVAIAKGGKFLGMFPVPEAGPVLSFVGEGGRDPYVRRLRRVCDAMNVKLEDIPLLSVPESAPLDEPAFRSTLETALEQHAPRHTSLDRTWQRRCRPQGADPMTQRTVGSAKAWLEAHDEDLVVPLIVLVEGVMGLVEVSPRTCPYADELGLDMVKRLTPFAVRLQHP